MVYLEAIGIGKNGGSGPPRHGSSGFQGRGARLPSILLWALAWTDRTLGTGDRDRRDQGDEQQRAGKPHSHQVIRVERLAKSGDVGFLGPAGITHGRCLPLGVRKGYGRGMLFIHLVELGNVSPADQAILAV